MKTTTEKPTTDSVTELAQMLNLSRRGETALAEAKGLIVLAVSAGSDGVLIWLRDGFDSVEEVEELALAQKEGYGDWLQPDAVLSLEGERACYREISYSRRPHLLKTSHPFATAFERSGADRYAGTILNGELVSRTPTKARRARRSRGARSRITSMV